ncbi:hypothetical protein FUAX_16000 [Fulvitalea axinellae]|uniref:Oxaloacetate decarboxylase (Na(+) extruding) n=1 Tax=Fulvitalea axinellae TaxID=1182444 RepID=A0AAU9CMC9_9BACT|nr:hypothetical protein FUAX_16000 [Fulvitalea axinellae]
MDKSLLLQDGITISITGITVIFGSLTALIFFFRFLIPFLITLPERMKTAKGKEEAQEAIKHEEARNLPGEVNAAIAAAVRMHLEEMHDDESTTLTIEQQQRRYSPWSSKIFVTQNSLR